MLCLLDLTVKAQNKKEIPLGMRHSPPASLYLFHSNSPYHITNSLPERFSAHLADYYNDHLEISINPQRTSDDYSKDFLRAGKRAGTDFLKDIEIVYDTKESIEEKFNEGAERVEEALSGILKKWGNWAKNFLSIEITPHREKQPYGSLSEDRFHEKYKVKLNISTDPSLQVRAARDWKLRLYRDEARIDYTQDLMRGLYGKLGISIPFYGEKEEKGIHPYLRVQKEWDGGELGVGVRTNFNKQADKREMYGGIFLTLRCR